MARKKFNMSGLLDDILGPNVRAHARTLVKNFHAQHKLFSKAHEIYLKDRKAEECRLALCDRYEGMYGAALAVSQWGYVSPDDAQDVLAAFQEAHGHFTDASVHKIEGVCDPLIADMKREFTLCKTILSGLRKHVRRGGAKAENQVEPE